MGRMKIEREIKRGKKKNIYIYIDSFFSLGRNAKRRREQIVDAFKKIVKKERAMSCHLRGDSQGGENKVLPPLRRHKKSKIDLIIVKL